MKKTNNRPLRFDTQKNARSMRTKRFVAAFSCFFVLLAGVSVLLLLKYYDFNLSSVIPADDETTNEATTAAPLPQAQGTRNYLLLCTADSGNNIRFAAILTADMDNTVLSIKGLSATQSLTANGCTGTMEQQLDFGGNSQLTAAIEAEYGTKIHKYIRSTDNGFKSIITNVGGFETTVRQPIDIRTPELTAIIAQGKQTMTGDTTLKYIRAYSTDPKAQAQIIAELFEQKLTQANFEKADMYYTKIINLTQSDISVLDFAQLKNSFKVLLNAEEPINIVLS